MDPVEQAASRIAFAIGEPARSRILFCLMDGRARTSTELSAVADVGTSTASVHLERLVKARLVRVAAEGRYRYYSLAGPEVGHLLEGLTAIAGAKRSRFVPSTPSRLRQARSCYDHLAGSLGRGSSRPAAGDGMDFRRPWGRGLCAFESRKKGAVGNRDRSRRRRGTPPALRLRMPGLERASLSSRGFAWGGHSWARAQEKMAASRAGEPRARAQRLWSAGIPASIRTGAGWMTGPRHSAARRLGGRMAPWTYTALT